MLELLKILKFIVAYVPNFIDKIPFRFCKGRGTECTLYHIFPETQEEKLGGTVYHGATCEPDL